MKREQVRPMMMLFAALALILLPLQCAGKRSADVCGTELLRPGGDVMAEIQPLPPLPQALGKLYRESLPPLRGKIAVSGRSL